MSRARFNEDRVRNRKGSKTRMMCLWAPSICSQHCCCPAAAHTAAVCTSGHSRKAYCCLGLCPSPPNNGPLVLVPQASQAFIAARMSANTLYSTCAHHWGHAWRLAACSRGAKESNCSPSLSSLGNCHPGRRWAKYSALSLIVLCLQITQISATSSILQRESGQIISARSQSYIWC